MARRSRGEWTPFEEVFDVPMKHLRPDSRIYRNSRYQVIIHPLKGGVEWLSIKRLSKAHIHDWRELLRIKNELTHPDREAFELYPGMFRVVDASNQYHLFVLPLGVGMNFGFISPHIAEDVPDADYPNIGRQRALPSWMEPTNPEGERVAVPIAMPADDDGNLIMTVELNMDAIKRREEG